MVNLAWGPKRKVQSLPMYVINGAKWTHAQTRWVDVQTKWANSQTKWGDAIQHIQMHNPISGSSDPTINGHHKEDHIRDENSEED